MTSVRNDMIPPVFEVEAQQLLADVAHATQLLASSEVVPSEVRFLVDQFDTRLHARNPAVSLASVDPYLVEGLLGGGLLCLKALRHDDATLERRDLRLGLEQVRQALRDIVDETPVMDDRAPKQLARWLVDVVALPQSDIARVLRVAPRTLQRWVSESDPAVPSSDDETRLRVVARIVSHLRHSFTGPGTFRWLERPHPQLDGKMPSSLLDDEATFPKLVRLAARARSMVAT